MIWKLITTNLIKWWYVIYTPVVKKIWPSKYDKEIYEAQHPEAAEEEDSDDDAWSDEESEEPDTDTDDNTDFDSDSDDNIDPSLLHDRNYNVTTHAMSGIYGQGPLDEEAKAKLDAIMKSNYNAVSPVSIDAVTEVVQNTNSLEGTDLTQAESEDALEQLKQAEEIYERLRREAEEDEARRQAEIEAAKLSAL